MAQIYQDNQGRSVYNNNGQVFDAKTGSALGAATAQPVVTTPTSPSTIQGTMTTPTTQPTTPSVTPTPSITPTTSAPGAGLDPGSFMNVLNGVKQNFSQNNDLINAKNLLLKGLFTSPLTPEQIQQLPPDIQQVYNGGNKDAIQLQVQALNERIQGGTTNYAQSVNYLVNGYKASLDDADNKRKEALSNIQNMIQIYGKGAIEGLEAQYPDLKPYLEELKGKTTLAEQKAAQEQGFTLSPGERRYDANGRAIASVAPNPSSGGNSNIMADNERALLSQFNGLPIVKDYNTILAKKQSVDQILNSKLGGPGDLAVVYEFMKGLDPTSVVRETEYESAAKSGNIFAGSLARFNGYLKPEGGFLPDTVKKSFQSIVDSKLKVQENLYDNAKKQYEDLASRQGLNPKNVVIDYGAANNSDQEPSKSPFADISQYITIDGDKAYIPRSVWSTLGNRMDSLIAEAKADGKTLLIKD